MPKKKLPKKNASSKKGASRHNKKDDERRYRDFENEVRDLGLMIRSTEGDGNCLFRAISDQMFGKEDAHSRIRQDVCDYIERNRTEFQDFLDEDMTFDDYVEEMRKNGTYGGNLELAAFAKMARCDIKVYQPGLIYVIPGPPTDYKGKRIIYHLAYYDWEHYASIGAQPGNNSIVKNQPLPDRYKQYHDIEEDEEDTFPSSPVTDSFEIDSSVNEHRADSPERMETLNKRKKGTKNKKKEEKSIKPKKAIVTDQDSVQEQEAHEAAMKSEKISVEEKSTTTDQNDKLEAGPGDEEHENEVAVKPTKVLKKKTNQDDEQEPEILDGEHKDDESVKPKKHSRKKKATLTRQEEKRLKKLAKLKRQEEMEPSTRSNKQVDSLPDGMKLLYI